VATSGLDVKQIRSKIAVTGIQQQHFAEMAGMSQRNMNDILWGRIGVGPVRLARIEAALEELDRNPSPRRVVRRGKTRAEQLRDEAIAAGGPSVLYW
jgi:hypothetical protein